MDLKLKFPTISTFKWHAIAREYLYSDSQTRLIIKGNQGGGTATAMIDLALRVIGAHPNPKRNVFDKPIRCVSKVVPKDHDDEENQQFVEFRRLIPPELWSKKLTARSKVGHIKRMCGGPDAKVEFMASTQDLDAFMSVQRSAYYQDEEIERVKWDENMMRLSKAASEKKGGDTTLSMTPVKGLDWSYDSLWKRATKIYRSKRIQKKFNLPAVEEQNNNNDIYIFSWSTFDNPVMTDEGIKNITKDIDDEDDLAMRVYGVFRQVSGRIYKVFDSKYHVLKHDFFDPNVFRNYWHYRVIDFHPTKPWYISWVAVTPTHEWIVWNELKAYHDKVTSFELRDVIKSESLLDEDDEFNRRTYIDPLACVMQANTNRSIKDDISSGELGLRRVESADTKNNNGRINVKTRLKNALSCGVPGNNIDSKSPPDIRFGQYKPTLWFLNSCEEHIEHFRHWRLVDYKQAQVKAERVAKKPSEKWSDYCRNLEFLGAANPVFYQRRETNWEPSKLFQGRRRA